MGILHGTATYRKFRVTDPLPKSFHEKLVQGLQRYGFREIDPKKNPEQSIGWVNAADPFDADLNLDKILYGDWVLIGLRWDRKSVPALLLKARTAERIRAVLAERRLRKLSREEIAQIRITVKETLLASVAPTTAVYEVLWHLSSGQVYLSTHATRVADNFVDLFEETTGLALEEETIVSRVEDFADRTGHDIDLEDLEETDLANRR